MKKQRPIRLSILVVMIAMAAVFGYILFGNLQAGERQINISLPGGEQSGAAAGEGGASPVLETDLTAVEVTTQNVQAVVKSMARPQSYHITMTLTNHYGDMTRTRIVDHWVSDANSRTRTVSGAVTFNELRWKDTVYLWNADDETYISYPVGDFSPDASAGMLTYEDVARIPVKQITSAAYEAYEDIPCIHIVAEDPELDYSSEYYISLDTGMLIYGAIRKGTTPIYSMTVTDLTQGIFDETVFMLPDGKNLIGT